jgi:hypothetical protein
LGKCLVSLGKEFVSGCVEHVDSVDYLDLEVGRRGEVGVRKEFSETIFIVLLDEIFE